MERDEWVMTNFPEDHCSSMGLGFDKRELRIIFVCRVESVTIFTLEVDEGLLNIILIDLGF